VNAFAASWLALRERADARARSSALAGAVAPAADDEVLRVLDLGAGTGANIRYLADRLPPNQDWLVVDRDVVLLSLVPEYMRSWAGERGHRVTVEPGGLVVRGPRLECTIHTHCADVGNLGDPGLFEGRALVTCSALLDLVSERWVQALARQCLQNRAAALLALTYDGRVRCEPVEAEDATIRDLVNRHQRSDKGFGAALGPDAADCATQSFGALGYRVRREPSDWLLSPDSRDLQEELLDGWSRAAIEIEPGGADWIESWLARRLGHVAAGRSHISVGHQDVAAWPPGDR
jgi:hypothetical protein